MDWSFHLLELPLDVILRIMRFTPPQTLIQLERTSRWLHHLVTIAEGEPRFQVLLHFYQVVDEEARCGIRSILEVELDNENCEHELSVDVEFTDEALADKWQDDGLFPMTEISFGGLRGEFDRLCERVLVKVPLESSASALLDQFLGSILRYHNFEEIGLETGASQENVEIVYRRHFFRKLKIRRTHEDRVPEELLKECIRRHSLTSLGLVDLPIPTERLSKHFFKTEEFLSLDEFNYEIAASPDTDHVWIELPFSDTALDNWRGSKLRFARVLIPVTVEAICRWVKRSEAGVVDGKPHRQFFAFTPAERLLSSWGMWEAVREALDLREIRWDSHAAEFYRPLNDQRRLRFVHHDTHSQMSWEVETYCEDAPSS